jgi:hypothetical protein
MGERREQAGPVEVFMDGNVAERPSSSLVHGWSKCRYVRVRKSRKGVDASTESTAAAHVGFTDGA